MIHIRTIKGILRAISGSEQPEDAEALSTAIQNKNKAGVLQILSKYVCERISLQQVKVIRGLLVNIPKPK